MHVFGVEFDADAVASVAVRDQASWLPLFGIGYFWMGWTGKADRTFMAVGAAG